MWRLESNYEDYREKQRRTKKWGTDPAVVYIHLS